MSKKSLEGTQYKNMRAANMFDFNRLKDDLARVAHEQWCRWAKIILADEKGISEERRLRWAEYINTPWEILGDTAKESDYTTAREIINVLQADAFANIVVIGEIILDAFYPPDVFVGKVEIDPDRDPGPQLIAALRAALEYVKEAEK